MTFHVYTIGPKGDREPVINGQTGRVASWPTSAAAQAWIDYWTTRGHPPVVIEYEIHEHREVA